jgi:hypothetical protein
MGHPNEDLLRRAYGLRDQAEVAPLLQRLHDDVVWHTDGGDLRGPDQVLATSTSIEAGFESLPR